MLSLFIRFLALTLKPESSTKMSIRRKSCLVVLGKDVGLRSTLSASALGKNGISVGWAQASKSSLVILLLPRKVVVQGRHDGTLL